ncbi:glycoside hydrolase family 28 protein [Telmatobacter bradus]|uniref:glycoside hydrolase family 28 protein n=1 Tax=Telmatobacter bradus TaxID=474953 RepID=UPI003B438A05
MGNKSFRLVAALGVASLWTVAAQSATVCDVHTFGAKGDGASKDTVAIQKAIDSCAAQGGGTVLLSAGTYVSGPIVIKSNITLHLDKGATLFGSPDHDDYPAKVEFHTPDRQPLVGAENASNIAIEGEGTIDGNGQSWWDEARHTKNAGTLGVNPRPKLIILDHSNHIRIEGITIQNSPMWQLVPFYSNDIVIRNVRVLAPEHSPNTDAIDPFSSSNILIEKVLADVGDDDIAIKSGPVGSAGPDDPSRNIIIRDCVFKHGHGLSIGSEIAGGVHNVLAERISFEGTDNGIRVKANRDRGNDVGNFTFRDITMKDVKNDIILSEYYPKVMPGPDDKAQPLGRLTPLFHDILIENLTATGDTNAGTIIGLPESAIQRVTLRNIKIQAAKPLSIGYAQVATENVKVDVGGGEGVLKLTGADVK